MFTVFFHVAETNTETMQLLSLYTVTKGKMGYWGSGTCVCVCVGGGGGGTTYKDVRMSEREEHYNDG